MERHKSLHRHGALERDNTRAIQLLTGFRGALQAVPILSIATAQVASYFDWLCLRFGHRFYWPAIYETDGNSAFKVLCNSTQSSAKICMEALPKRAPRLEEEDTASASSWPTGLCEGSWQLQNSLSHWQQDRLQMRHRESLDGQRKRAQLGKEEQPHRAAITALKYSMSSSQS